MKTPILLEHLTEAQHHTGFATSELRNAHRINRNKFEQDALIQMISDLIVIGNKIDLMLQEDDEE